MKIFKNVALCSLLASAQTITVTSTAATTTTEYYDRYTTYSTGTTTSTTSSADSTWNPYMTTTGDTSCAMYHNDLDSFFSQVKYKCSLSPLEQDSDFIPR